MPEVTIALGVREIAAISARAEVERVAGEYGVWSKLWERVEPQIAEEERPVIRT